MLEIRVVFAEGIDEDKVRGVAARIRTWPGVLVVEPSGFEADRAHTDAEKFLMSLFPEFYADGDFWQGPLPVEEIRTLGEDQGFTYDQLHEASKSLGWGRLKLRGMAHGPWYWHPSISTEDMYGD